MTPRDVALVEAVRAEHAQRRRAATLEAQAATHAPQAAMPRYQVATIDDVLTVIDSRGDSKAVPAIPAGRWVTHVKRWSEKDAALVADELNGGMPAVVFHWAYPVTA